jgi:virginiamycin B lyase
LSLIATLLFAAPSQAAPTLEEFAPVPTANAGIQDIVQGPDGNMWFTERNANMIGRISGTTPGATTEFPLAGGATSPDLIVVGPDGALWYTQGTSVGRMPPDNPAGVQTFGGLGIIQARGIAVGPDGNLWVSDADGAGNKVHRITPAGTAASLPIPLPMGVNARGIALGPDGNMWVADFSTPGGVVQVTTGATPTATRFAVPAGSPIDVIGGSDGNVWYAGQGTTVGKVAPDGTATAFTSKGVDPFGVTLGPDGAVWFAEFQANAVGRVGTDGTTSEVTGMTAGAGPRYVASGPGNTIWFTEETGNRVGRVTGIDVGGGGGGGGGGGADTTDPVLSTLKLSAKRFRLGSKLPSVAAVRIGLTIRYTLSDAATVTLSFERVTRGRKVGRRCVKAKRSNRRRKACKRYAAVKPALSFANQAAGPRSIRFEGRLNRRKTLKPGVYRLTLRARDLAGNRSAPLRAKITVLPRKRKR